MARLAHSLVSLRAQVDAIAPGRSRKADGWIGDAAHASRASDHNPDYGGVVRALDLTDDPKGGLDALWLREALRESRDPRIKYLISEGEICNSRRVGATPAWAWRPYTGPNGHFHHLHISVQPAATGDQAGDWNLRRDFGAPVRPINPARPAPAPEEDVMASIDELRAVLREEIAKAGPGPTASAVWEYGMRDMDGQVRPAGVLLRNARKHATWGLTQDENLMAAIKATAASRGVANPDAFADAFVDELSKRLES